MRMMAIVGMLLASLTTIGATPQGNPEAAKIKNPVAATPESIATGKQVYRAIAPCATAPPGKVDREATSARRHPISPTSEWKHGSTDGEIFYVIKNGVPPELNMEPWGDRIKDDGHLERRELHAIAGEKEVTRAWRTGWWAGRSDYPPSCLS